MTAPVQHLDPENWLTYRGDHRESVGQLMGPNTMGEVCTVVAADYVPAESEHPRGTCETCDLGQPHHAPGENQDDDPWCSWCEVPWPCDASRGTTRLGLMTGDVRSEIAGAA